MSSEDVLLRLVGGDPAAERAVADAAVMSEDVAVLAAAAALTGSSAPLKRAAGLAVQPRERQLVALTRAYLDGSADLFDALVRDHLAAYPDQVFAAWLASRAARSMRPAPLITTKDEN